MEGKVQLQQEVQVQVQLRCRHNQLTTHRVRASHLFNSDTRQTSFQLGAYIGGAPLISTSGGLHPDRTHTRPAATTLAL
ncbi:hypothetical protein HYQ44_017855 [Verticillium longisporum]|nr:hypothetical protein HYQ44_017855 [Verticillium longisporum]